MLKRTVVAAEVLLILPACLFMAALVVRNLSPAGQAHRAAAVVAWFAARPGVGLWGLLITLPLVALVTGCATLLRRWGADQPPGAESAWSALIVAGTTLTAGVVLAIVAVHVLSN